MTEDRNIWKDAIIDESIVSWVYCEEHETNPRKALNDILVWNQMVALDPLVSKSARDLWNSALDAVLQLDVCFDETIKDPCISIKDIQALRKG